MPNLIRFDNSICSYNHRVKHVHKGIYKSMFLRSLKNNEE